MSYLALYREWRPRTFGEIIGQDHITRTLKNAVEAGREGHAYLFCGTRGTGKTTAAKVLAKALNCTRREGAEPCNSCDNCKTINEGICVDVVEIDAASNRGIDEIRDLREKINFSPTRGRYRIYIIDEVHMLTSEAFNALLKTLEEPPRHAIMILATTEPHKLPMTILSRCQRFNFKRILPADIIRRLKEVAGGSRLEVEEEALRLIARAADGGLRDALSILDQGAAFGGTNITAEDIHSILGTVRADALGRMSGYLAAGETGEALRLVAELTDEGKDLRLFAREMAGYLRALLLGKIDPGASAGEVWDEPGRMTARAAEFAQEGLARVVDVMVRTEQDMKNSALPGIVLELALVKACHPVTGEDVASLYARLEAVEEKLKTLTRPGVKTEKVRPVPSPLPMRGGALQDKAKPPVRPPTLPERREASREVAVATETGAPEEDISLEQIKESWGRVLDTLRKERLPISSNYSRTIPLVVKNRGLVVGFPEGDTLGREMADQTENKKYFEELLGRVFGGQWRVAFRFYQKIETGSPGKGPAPKGPVPKEPVPKTPVADVKRRFGGEEINLDDEYKDTLF